MYMNVDSSPFHNSHKFKTTQKFISIRMDKYIVEYLKNWILVSIMHNT